MDRIPKPNEIYQHFKGDLYRVVTLAKHADTGESLVVYQALYGNFEVFVRPLAEFMEKLDREKYPDAQAECRFTLLPQIVGQASPQALFAQQDAAVLPVPPAEQMEAGNKEAVETAEARGNTESAENANAAENDGSALDPMLLSFLDAGSYEEKLEIFVAMRDRVTDDMLTTMAVSLDIDLAPGELMDRYEELKNCILMLEKYECNRLR